MHSLDFKAELRDPDLGVAICRAIGATPLDERVETDTYFRTTHGRFKRRERAGEPPAFIFYDRSDRSRPKLSHFTVYTESEATARFGNNPLPVRGVVRKRRCVWMHGAVRVHLDHIVGLGDFLELETLVSPENNVARAHAAVAALREAFSPALGEAISCAYVDLIPA